MTLTEFLLARIGEDERAAQDARDDAVAWESVPPYSKLGFNAGDLARRFDPARVLAECEAKRRIVWLHTEYVGYVGYVVIGRPETESYGCNECVEDGWADAEPHEEGPASWPCRTLRALALPYADHPDFREEWRA